MYERDRQLLEYFDGLGIRPGVDLKVLGRNYDGTLTLRFGKNSLNLGESAARKVWVSYHLTVSAPGFGSKALDVGVNSAVPVNLKVALELAGAKTTVTVSTEAADLIEYLHSMK